MSETGAVLAEGKTKVVLELLGKHEHVLLQSKDRITAHNAARSDDMAGKAQISNQTTGMIFEYLARAGVRTHYVQSHNDTSFVARRCHMVPIEWVTRRIATGSFLKRNPGVPEGYVFRPVKLEIFFKDDAAGDPQWSFEQLLARGLTCGKRAIGQREIDVMAKMTICIFEMLERAWRSLDCTLVDMKVEYGVDADTGEILLADVIDSDSWRLWPQGDRRLMKDKQVYRDLDTVTPTTLETVKTNFAWIAEKVRKFSERSSGQVVVFMGSASDLTTSSRVQSVCDSCGVTCHLRVTSAHKGTDETLRILAEYEAQHVAMVIVAVAGRSNGLGPVLAGNTVIPVINCPPVTAEWGAQDIWSSLRLPSGLGCSTVLSPEGAALQALQILALSDHVIWSSLKARQLNTWVRLKDADAKLSEGLA
ncbi:PREDICTED: multifunctional protein ADE2-like [Priapulus caudatus]|uniref:Multifunctional protein ADE2-like n=1 Tax=Priapulus caudatus TaxID=37621 RepID=A0ABM1DXH7_PRICU|nr:PREDICTED: multifunctional protein ADE2-like [Priapulus caudatus]XP_014664649.1 PREDICTED: multifunctional protein ADE2-like [Priapulus caudatus]XP_014664650.1 PREDICTED: multifunctional protein ADE2-like [Priapulus caudatus]